MRNLQVDKSVKLTLTADDWQLYEKPGVDDVAKKLNKEIGEVINNGLQKGLKRTVITNQYAKVLRQFSEFGASDSEGFGVVERILDKVMPEEE